MNLSSRASRDIKELLRKYGSYFTLTTYARTVDGTQPWIENSVSPTVTRIRARIQLDATEKPNSGDAPAKTATIYTSHKGEIVRGDKISAGGVSWTVLSVTLCSAEDVLIYQKISVSS